MKNLFSCQSISMVFTLIILSSINAYADPDKVVIIPMGADAFPAGTLSGQEIVSSSNQAVSANGIAGISATCPNDKIVLAGGFTQTNSSGSPIGALSNPLSSQASYPSSRNSWYVAMNNTSSSINYFRAYAICATEN